MQDDSVLGGPAAPSAIRIWNMSSTARLWSMSPQTRTSVSVLCQLSALCSLHRQGVCVCRELRGALAYAAFRSRLHASSRPCITIYRRIGTAHCMLAQGVVLACVNSSKGKHRLRSVLTISYRMDAGRLNGQSPLDASQYCSPAPLLSRWYHVSRWSRPTKTERWN